MVRHPVHALGHELSVAVTRDRANPDRREAAGLEPRRVQRIASPEYGNNHPTSQESGMFRSFSRIVLSGRLEPQWETIALATQKVVNACLESAKNDGKRISL